MMTTAHEWADTAAEDPVDEIWAVPVAVVVRVVEERDRGGFSWPLRAPRWKQVGAWGEVAAVAVVVLVV